MKLGSDGRVLDRCFNFIHKIRITLQGALRPWCNSKFHFIKFLPDLILDIRPFLYKAESHTSKHLSSKSHSKCVNLIVELVHITFQYNGNRIFEKCIPLTNVPFLELPLLKCLTNWLLMRRPILLNYYYYYYYYWFISVWLMTCSS